jgi:hypothetical protein
MISMRFAGRSPAGRMLISVPASDDIAPVSV